MATTTTLLQVFLASPGDVTEERQTLEEVINEFNVTWGDTHRVRLELLKWETHTRPGIGESPQDVVNQQIGDEYDIFLGIMWGRFGSPTNRAESGTEEEFNRAYSRWKTSPSNLQIMFYFKEAGIPPAKMDLEQLAKVKRFRRRIEAECGGLCHEFESTEEFRTKMRIHLSKVVQDWLADTGGRATTPAPAPASDAFDPLANLTALADDDFEEGLIELSEQASDAMAMVVGVVQTMSDATNELGHKFQQRTDEINQLTATVAGDMKIRKARRK